MATTSMSISVEQETLYEYDSEIEKFKSRIARVQLTKRACLKEALEQMPAHRKSIAACRSAAQKQQRELRAATVFLCFACFASIVAVGLWFFSVSALVWWIFFAVCIVALVVAVLYVIFKQFADCIDRLCCCCSWCNLDRCALAGCGLGCGCSTAGFTLLLCTTLLAKPDPASLLDPTFIVGSLACVLLLALRNREAEIAAIDKRCAEIEDQYDCLENAAKKRLAEIDDQKDSLPEPPSA